MKLAELKRRVKRWLDKGKESPGLIKSGNWYCRYPDGTRTHNMTFDVVSELREIFGGVVYHVTDNDPAAKQNPEVQP